ncbi:MAG: HAMP domain-containing histidine kinase [Rhodobacteraceae bacterium]|nr:HAMP domain-containing histidine kinase [Paracoccaceae bacterium]
MRSSLKLRLTVAAAVSTLAALFATALLLTQLFRAYFEERINAELESYLVQLTSQAGLDANGEVTVSELADPRFSEPLSGYYWQIQAPDMPVVLSQSFWSEPLELYRPAQLGQVSIRTTASGDGTRLQTGSWLITLQHDGTDQELFLTVAIDLAQVESSISGFSRNVWVAMAVLGTFLIVAAWVQVRVGLLPFERIRAEVNRVRERPDTRLSQEHPTELEPLVAEVNSLLDHQQDTIEAARAHASTLAHGLKTPLTVMRALSEDLKKHDHPLISAEIDGQVDNMHHLVERELARTRDQVPARDAWCRARPVVDNVVKVFQRRLGKGRLTWHIDVADTARCPFDEYALTELLGNLIDNASKWAENEIWVSVHEGRTGGYIEVCDDGHGVADADLASALDRGTRLDNSVSGHGLGLAIVMDMAEQRGAHFHIGNRPEGGLRASVDWADAGPA